MRRSKFGILSAGFFALGIAGGCSSERRDFSEGYAFRVYDPTGRAEVYRNLRKDEIPRLLGEPASAEDYRVNLEFVDGKFVEHP